MGESYMEIMLDTANTKSIYSCQQFLNLIVFDYLI